MLFGEQMTKEKAGLVSLPLLAHLGDAVFHLYERERQIATCVSARQLHEKLTTRVAAIKQAQLLWAIKEHLTPDETVIVRRAGNLRAKRSSKVQQANYRAATAFEALIGYLYLTDKERLKDLLDLTLAQ